ncbi:MAG: carbamoyltransferase HypF [Candidatus Omnitrophica bacterium]|nr:carbamoyltransferase HypF [Candidatus Omnitrophota bacterium]MCK5491659.1 carbamoyltransferase HypF [Candidatus Omnitrophota bacterium]
MKLDNKNLTKIQIKTLDVKKDKTVLALGAELKANFCIIQGRTAFLYSGFDDLKNPFFFNKYKKSLDTQLKKLSRKPQLIAHDLNSSFFSTRLAKELKEKSLKSSRIAPIQHHYAHVGGALASLDILDKTVIGISCDGTGLGDDGKVWGCEFIVYEKKDYNRQGHLNEIALPGSDKAVHEPWRVGVALLYKVYGRKLLSLKLPWIKNKKYIINILIDMIERDVNTPLATSAGRLFDGVAGICGLCFKIKYEAQGAITLQKYAQKAILRQRGSYEFSIKKENGLFVINTDEMIRAIVDDLVKKKSIDDIAACFHNTFSQMLITMCVKIGSRDKINNVVLSGGVFFNEIISKQVTAGLNKREFNVHIPEKLFLGDTGLSLGQAVIAAYSV